MVSDLEALRQHWGADKINLFGHSWGGALATKYAVEYPDRTAAVILVNSGRYVASNHYPDEAPGRKNASFVVDTPPEIIEQITRSVDILNSVAPSLAQHMIDQYKLKFIFSYFADLSSIPSKACDDDSVNNTHFDPYMDNAHFNIAANVLIDKSLNNNSLNELRDVQAPMLFFKGECDYISSSIVDALNSRVKGLKKIDVVNRGHQIFYDWSEDYVYLNMAAAFFRGQRDFNSPTDFEKPIIKPDTPYRTHTACLDVNGETISETSCNQFWDQQLSACPAGHVYAANENQCVSVFSYKNQLIGCLDTNDCNQLTPYEGFQPFEYSTYQDLVTLEGNKDSDTIVLFAQGGPSPVQETDYVDFLEEEFLVAYIAQANTVKPHILQTFNMSSDEAMLESNESIQFMRAVHLGLKQTYPNKKIVLVGHSMGAFLSMEYIKKYGFDDLHAVVPIAGRLRVPNDFLYRFALGQDINYQNAFIGPDTSQSIMTKFWFYNPDAESNVVDNKAVLIKVYDPANADSKILSSLGRRNDLLDLKSTKDLSKLMYVYSDYDEKLDGLDTEEIAFIKNRGGQVLESGTNIPEVMGHSWMLYNSAIQKKIINFLRHRDLSITSRAKPRQGKKSAKAEFTWSK
ncbi:proline iminopeptidase [Elysia marginata]|uniref:Proline iminopeptidase n=1 Tax=Elysia marginata TaxID=1093978 RepID=A0AAV4HXN0_9GAST|nr:proline iminopeptidase [Elysia marginata]